MVYEDFIISPKEGRMTSTQWKQKHDQNLEINIIQNWNIKEVSKKRGMESLK